MLKANLIKIAFITFTSLIYLSCKTDKVVVAKNYLRWVDDIAKDTTIDRPDFKICNSENQVIQYFNDSKGLLYNGGKLSITKIFTENFNTINSNYSGLVRIRFIVNCKGESGRFRLVSMNKDYKEITFNTKITDQLLNITKSLDGWQIKSLKGNVRDYYQYLIFKIEKGKLIKILP